MIAATLVEYHEMMILGAQGTCCWESGAAVSTLALPMSWSYNKACSPKIPGWLVQLFKAELGNLPYPKTALPLLGNAFNISHLNENLVIAIQSG